VRTQNKAPRHSSASSLLYKAVLTMLIILLTPYKLYTDIYRDKYKASNKVVYLLPLSRFIRYIRLDRTRLIK